MALKDYFESDLQNIIFNTDEFAEEHRWNNQTIKVVVDDDSLMKNYQAAFQLLPKGSHRVLVPASQLLKKPKTGAVVMFDGEVYTIEDVDDQQGMYVIHLARGRG